LENEGQTFVFQAVLAGAYELKFYRQDFIRDYITNDLVTLIVEEEPEAEPPLRFGAPVERGTVTAEPRWPGIAGETSPESATAGGTSVQNTPPVSVTTPPISSAPSTAVAPETAETDSPPIPSPETSAEEYLRRAREERDAGHIPQAIAALDQFMARFPLGSDEALWLYAQLYEAAGPSRNIRSALDCYRRLIDEYPQSSRYTDARRRIAYLERYYITIQ
jgi:tetratricopeptide (TPR) repeat protein